MFLPIFIAFLVQGLLLGLAALALLAPVPKLQKRYGPRWLCRLWVTLAVLFLVPVRALVPQAPAAVSVSAAPLYTPVTVQQEETTQKPAGNVPYKNHHGRRQHHATTSCPAQRSRPAAARFWNALPSTPPVETLRRWFGNWAFWPLQCTSSAAMPSGAFAWATTRSRWLKLA